VAANGIIAGVVSVPTLYRQDELDEEVSRQNALIFGVYAFVLFAIVIIATTFANRIAAPIHRLTEATKKVSRGDLDVNVRVTTSDGEIGELIRAFERMTKDLKRSREELIRFERDLAWKEMAKQVAHEIKNPLTPMKLSLQHLRQTYKDKVPDLDRVFDEVSRTIIEQIDTLGRIASEFSHFARMPKPQLERCDVNNVLAESIHLFDQELNVRFEWNVEKRLPTVLADREELRRAFINIIRNSIQAMENGGRIVITTKQVDTDVVISIQDFGAGIPDELKERLFQPNFSTKTDGMGLGLAIVKKTIDDLNGTITINSEEGEGTTVTIRLPRTDNAPM
jgi:nitrogen fixation/metabolism regulation signal transduction histidine kinase